MKRIIAAALSILVGAFGYTIVDSAIEDRVATLESEVVELREEVSRYHPQYTTSPYEGSEVFTTIPHYFTTELHEEVQVGSFLAESSNTQHKFLLRKWTDGRINYIPPYNYSEVTSNTYVPTTTQRYTAVSTTPYVQTSLLSQYEVGITDPLDERLDHTTTKASTSYKDYFLYITTSSAQIIESTKKETYSYWYDKEYSKVSTAINKPVTTVEFIFKGYTDPVFAGKTLTLSFSVGEDDYGYVGDFSITGTIGLDGTFELHKTLDFNYSLNYFIDAYYYSCSVSVRNNVTTTTRLTTGPDVIVTRPPGVTVIDEETTRVHLTTKPTKTTTS